MVFNVDVHRAVTWRERFVRLARNPITALTLQRNPILIARGVSLDIRSGERVGILGVNGCGKTSLCRCIAGMYKPSAGSIAVRGNVRAIFDTSVGIQPELTGRENASLLVEFMYPDVADKRRLIDDALEFSGLGQFVDVPFRLYSNGMQARLCLSVVSCRPGDLLILDEVFEGADAVFRKKVAGRVLKMIQESGAVIFVSHAYDELRTVANRLLVLHQAQIVYDGPVEEGIHYYKQLIGEGN